MSKREPILLVGDILESAHKILDYTTGQNFEDFKGDSKTEDAVIRNWPSTRAPRTGMSPGGWPPP